PPPPDAPPQRPPLRRRRRRSRGVPRHPLHRGDRPLGADGGRPPPPPPALAGRPAGGQARLAVLVLRPPGPGGGARPRTGGDGPAPRARSWWRAAGAQGEVARPAGRLGAGLPAAERPPALALYPQLGLWPGSQDTLTG